MTDPEALLAAHPGFIDIAHVRRQNPDVANVSATSLARALLDPDRDDLPAPNRIFDVGHYKAAGQAHDVIGPVNPVLHYLTRGAREGRSINALFDAAFYARRTRLKVTSPTAAALHALGRFDTGLSDFSPFVDVPFLAAATGRDPDARFLEDLFAGRVIHDHPHPFVDLGHLRAETGLPGASMPELLRHYWEADCDTAIHPLFDLDHYKAQVPGGEDIARAGYHYLVSSNPPSPHPLFDPEFYATRLAATNDAVAEARIEHFISTGAALGLSPSPFFDVAYYRAQAGCEANPLVAYLAGGYRLFAPHPMMDRWATPLLEKARGPTGRPLATLLAGHLRNVPLAATPDFSPDHYRKLTDDTRSSPEELREHYLRNGYPAGVRPNGLISIPYIKAQCRRTGIAHPNPVAHYFESGWGRRRRLMFVLPDMDETDRNRAILGLCASQLGHPDLDIVVVAGTEGRMSSAFSEVAHIWHCSSLPLSKLDSAALRDAVMRLGLALRANPPLVALVDCEADVRLVAEMSRLGVKVALHGDRGLARLSGDDLRALCRNVDLVLTDSASVTRALDKPVVEPAGARICVAPGLRLVEAAVPPSLTARAKTRAQLDLDTNEVLILSGGEGTLAAGADLFGALAALCGGDGSAFSKAIFVWHGAGTVQHNSPLFYARHFAGLSPHAPIKLRLVDRPGVPAILAAADIYVDLGRNGGGAVLRSRAFAAGLPIISMDPSAGAGPPDPEKVGQTAGGGAIILVDSFDLSAARDALGQLVTDAKLCGRQDPVAALGLGRVKGLPGLIARTSAALQRIAPDLTLEDSVRPAIGRMLVVLADLDLLLDTDVPSVRIEKRPGGDLTWYDLAQTDLPLRHPDIASVLLDGGCREIAFTTTPSILQAASVETFDRSLWLLRGDVGELRELVALGPAFDRLITARQDQIDSLAAINPDLAARLEFVEWIPG
jgi:hypothetical protein